MFIFSLHGEFNASISFTLICQLDFSLNKRDSLSLFPSCHYLSTRNYDEMAKGFRVSFLRILIFLHDRYRDMNWDS